MMKRARHRRPKRELGCALAVLAALLLPWPAAAQDASTFAGSFVFAGGAEQRDARDRLVEEVLAEFNALLRSFARRALTKSCAIPERIDIRQQGEELSIALGPLPARASRLDGVPTRFNNTDGDPVTMHRRLRRQALVETLQRGSSRRVLTFRLSPDSQRLSLTWRVESRHLPRSVEYLLTYRREGP